MNWYQYSITYILLAIFIFFLIKTFTINNINNKQICLITLCIIVLIIIVIFIMNQQKCSKENFNKDLDNKNNSN